MTTETAKHLHEMTIEEIHNAICILQVELQYRLLGCPKKGVHWGEGATPIDFFNGEG